MISALKGDSGTKEMAGVLAGWNFEDRPDLAAPTVFQAVYTEFARLVFRYRLGDETAALMLKSWYFWQERLQRELLEGSLSGREADPLLRQAARNANATLSPVLGKYPARWLWGKAHTIEFVNPIRRKGFGKELLGAVYPMSGSGETIYRAVYDFRTPFGVTYSASLRMVADLGDGDKVLAVIPGGVCGRVFHPHTKDQLDAFMNGEKRYWWFSDKAIREHTRSTLILVP
jgi:penicillin amidase